MIDKIFYLGTILFGKAIACSIGNVYNCSASLNNSLDNPGKIFVIASACIFCIKLHIVGKFPCIFNSIGSSSDNLFRSSLDLMHYMHRRSSYTCVYPLPLCILKCFSCNLYIFFYGACEAADYRICNGFGNFNN